MWIWLTYLGLFLKDDLKATLSKESIVSGFWVKPWIFHQYILFLLLFIISSNRSTKMMINLCNDSCVYSHGGRINSFGFSESESAHAFIKSQKLLIFLPSSDELSTRQKNMVWSLTVDADMSPISLRMFSLLFPASCHTSEVWLIPRIIPNILHWIQG